MRSMTAAEAGQAFDVALDAASREPVVIRERDRDVAVLLSADDYARLCADQRRGFEDLCDRLAARAADRGLTGAVADELLGDVR
jgi:PHD/YefM family antitoxin component YafN of YafNO toxin-antitoxin module